MSNQLNLLQTYSKKLEQENEAKTNEIVILRTLMNENKATSATNIIQTSNAKTVCYNCQNKQNEIDRLNRTIKDMKQSHEREINNLRSQRTERVVYRDAPAQSSAELLQLRKQYEELKVKYEEVQRTEWNTIRVDTTEQELREEISRLRLENGALHESNRDLQHRTASVEEVNRILRDEITSLLRTKPLPSPIYTPAYRPAPTYRYLVPQTTYIPSPQVNKSFSLDRSVYHDVSSPLSVLNNEEDFSFEGSFYGSALDERKLSLQHKIKLLEQENSKLRSEMNFGAYEGRL